MQILALFPQVFAHVWRAVLARTLRIPPRMSGTYLLKMQLIFVLRQLFFLRFLCLFLNFLSSVFVSIFLDRALFLFVRRKTQKTKNATKNWQKISTHFFVWKVASSAGSCDDAAPDKVRRKMGDHKTNGFERVSGLPEEPLWGVGPPQANFTDSKITSKRHAKSAKNEAKKRQKTTPKTCQKIKK